MRICLAVALLLGAFSGAGANLLVNGDFSDWPGAYPTEWWIEDTTKARVERCTDPVRSVEYSAKMTRMVAGTSNNAGVNQRYIAVTPGEPYTLTAWIYDDEDSASGGVQFSYYDADTVYIGVSSGSAYSEGASPVWQRVSKTDTIPSGAALVKVTLRVYGMTGAPAGGVIYFDDADFVQGAGGIEEGGLTTGPNALTVEPNPTPGRVLISFEAPRPGPLAVGIYDLTGSLRALVRADARTPGRQVVAWDGTDSVGVPLASGLYFAVLNDPEGSTTVRKVVLQR